MAFPSGEDIEQRAGPFRLLESERELAEGEMSPGAPPRLPAR